MLIPDLQAGCSLAASIDADAAARVEGRSIPARVVVSYVNTTAEVKAESDYCCTSGNARAVIEAIPADREILFLPDMFLGLWLERVTGRKLKIWLGECHVHAGIRPGRHRALAGRRARRRAARPSRVRLREPGDGVRERPHAHPLDRGDGRLRPQLAEEALRRRDRDRDHPPAEQGGAREASSRPRSEAAVCQFMKMITLEKARDSLRDLKYEVTVEPGDRRPRPRRDRPHGRDRLATTACDHSSSGSRSRLDAPGRWSGVVASVARGRRRHGGDRRARALDPGAQPRRRSTSSPCCRSRSSGGSRYAVAVSVASMLAFNFFFLEPVHTLTLADSRNWFALARLRRHLDRRLASSRPGRGGGRARPRCSPRSRPRCSSTAPSSAELERISADAARALQVELGARSRSATSRATATRSTAGGRRVGTIRLEGGSAARRERAPAAAAGARLAARRRDRPRAARRARRSRPRRCGAPTRSRRRCSGRSATTCGRR